MSQEIDPNEYGFNPWVTVKQNDDGTWRIIIDLFDSYRNTFANGEMVDEGGSHLPEPIGVDVMDTWMKDQPKDSEKSHASIVLVPSFTYAPEKGAIEALLAITET